MIRPASSARLRPLCLLLLASIAGAAFGQSAKRAPNPVFAPVSDLAGLPRVLLIGDSISIGYTLAVRRLLEGQANLHRIPENGGPTIRGVEKIDAWLGDGRWDVIHFNFGLHDLKIMDTGKHQVPIGEYERNMERIVGRLKKTGAKLIWAPTTPVPEGDLRPRRSNDDVIAYNRAAQRVMAAHGVRSNDLYSFALPRLAEIQRPVNVHFTDQGSDALAEQVAKMIAHALKR